MQTLDTVEERLAQVIGAAYAGVAAARAARGVVAEPEVVAALAAMETESRRVAQRCEAVARAVSANPAPLLRVARSSTRTAATMMGGYLGPAPGPAVAIEYLCLAKAGEVGRWVLLGAIAEGAGQPEVSELARWALPLLREHLLVARRVEEQADAAGAVALT